MAPRRRSCSVAVARAGRLDIIDSRFVSGVIGWIAIIWAWCVIGCSVREGHCRATDPTTITPSTHAAGKLEGLLASAAVATSGLKYEHELAVRVAVAVRPIVESDSDRAIDPGDARYVCASEADCRSDGLRQS